MRKITKESVEKFLAKKEFEKDNMRVSEYDGELFLSLHGNDIAVMKKSGEILISNAGWETNTTKERLNGLLSALNKGYIFRKDFSWYWNIEGKTIPFPSGRHEWLSVSNFVEYLLTR